MPGRPGRRARLTEQAQKNKRRGGQPPPEGWKEVFLQALQTTHMVTEACKAAGVSRAHVYRVRARDPEFADRWENEEERSTEVLEQVAIRRALEGSDNLMVFLLKSRRPHVYRENVHHEHQVNGQVSILHEGLQPISVEAAERRKAAQMLLEAHALERGETGAGDVVEGEFEEEWDGEDVSSQ